MKHLFTLKSLLLTLVMLCGLNAWGETYSFEITTNDFNSTSYAANNNDKTTTAVCTTDAKKTIDVTWYSNQVMLQSSEMQWKKKTGYIYNKTDLGTIKSVVIKTTSGTFTTYYGTSQNPTSNTTVGGGYFTIKTGFDATGKTSKIVVTFEVSDAPAASIAIEGEASKTLYEAGETFSTSGLKVIATRTDGTTSDVTGDVAWTFDPETLTVETTTVKVTAEYNGFTASKDVAVTVVAAAPSVKLDLTTTAQIKGTPNEDLLEYDANVLTVSSARTDSKKTAANNYYGGDEGNHTSTRFYTGSIVTFTPATNFEIVSITYNATSEGYATALATSTWTNASATADVETVTITPKDGTQPFSAKIGGTAGATSMVIKYRVLTVIETETGLDAVLKGTVCGKYQINTPLRVNYTDAKYAYASTIGGGSTKTAPTEAQKEEWWSDKEEDGFNQNDWVAIQNSGLEVGAEIEAGSVATLVSNSEFPVIKFDSMNSKLVTAIAANTYRVANFVDSDNELVKKLWLVDPQPAEHCFVKGYVASLEDVLVDADAGVGLAEIKSGEKDVVTMYVNYKTTDFSITATGWYRFEGVVVNGTSGLELNAVNVNEGTATGVEGVETSSVKVYGAEGVINVESEEVAPIAVYSANGAIVSSVEASSASIAVAPGFYIVKAGNSVSKVTVK